MSKRTVARTIIAAYYIILIFAGSYFLLMLSWGSRLKSLAFAAGVGLIVWAIRNMNAEEGDDERKENN